MEQDVWLLQYYFVEIKIVNELFLLFDKSIAVKTINPIHNGMRSVSERLT